MNEVPPLDAGQASIPGCFLDEAAPTPPVLPQDLPLSAEDQAHAGVDAVAHLFANSFPVYLSRTRPVSGPGMTSWSLSGGSHQVDLGESIEYAMPAVAAVIARIVERKNDERNEELESQYRSLLDMQQKVLVKVAEALRDGADAPAPGEVWATFGGDRLEIIDATLATLHCRGEDSALQMDLSQGFPVYAGEFREMATPNDITNFPTRRLQTAPAPVPVEIPIVPHIGPVRKLTPAEEKRRYRGPLMVRLSYPKAAPPVVKPSKRGKKAVR